MFSKRDEAPASTYQPVPPSAKRGSSGHGFSVIGSDVVVTGNIRATADLHIEGRVDGDLDCGNLVIGGDATVKGQVRAESARVAGTIEGSVAIRQLLVEAGAKITGDVEYETISIENGAQIDGRLKHGSVKAPAAPATTAIGGPKEFKLLPAGEEAAA